MFKIGHEQKLKQDDIYSVFPEDHSQRLGEELQGSREEGRESENFHVGLKVHVAGALLLLGSPEPPPLTLNAHLLRLTQGSAHFGGCGSPCSLCICGNGGSPQPWPWRLSSVSGGGVPGGRSLPPPKRLMICESSKAWKELISRIGTFSPQSLLFWCFRVYTAHLSGAL